MKKFAEILIHKQNIYTYAVPEELTATIEIGNEVTVKLRNKESNGYVIRFVEKPEFKTLNIVCINSPVKYFDSKLIELAEYISQKYKCLFSTAMKAILPKD